MPARSLSFHLSTHLHEKARDPVWLSQALQLVKTVVAAVIAWVTVAEVLDLPSPFLAPWAALIVVNSTIYRTFNEGLVQVVSTVVGVLLAWMIGHTLGLSALSLSLMLFAGLLVGTVRWFRGEPTAVATAALFVLTTGYATNDQVLIARLVDTGIGLASGLLVNVLVWPPLHDETAARSIDTLSCRVGTVLRDMADDLRRDRSAACMSAWADTAGELEDDINEAWGQLRQAWESGKFNPRPGADEVRTPGDWRHLLNGIDRAVAEILSLAHTLEQSSLTVEEWDHDFAQRWLALLDSAGDALVHPESARLDEVHRLLAELSRDVSDESRMTANWPEYGALIVSLRNVVTAMRPVAAAHPLTAATVRSRRTRGRHDRADGTGGAGSGSEGLPQPWTRPPQAERDQAPRADDGGAPERRERRAPAEPVG